MIYPYSPDYKQEPVHCPADGYHFESWSAVNPWGQTICFPTEADAATAIATGFKDVETFFF